MICYATRKDGGFVAGDTDTEMTSYAYPSSIHATAAKKRPECTAARMMEEADKFGAPVTEHAEYHRRHWAVLNGSDGVRFGK